MEQCNYFGNCGGCSAQHIPYELQLQNKQKVVQNELKKNNIQYNKEIPIFSGESLYYRNRMDFVFSSHGIGLRQKQKFSNIIQIEQCIIANKKINAILKEINEWFSANKHDLEVFNLQKMTGTLKYAVIRAAEYTDSATISFILNSDSTKLGQHTELIKNFKTSAKNVIIGRVPAKSDLSISADCFAVKGGLLMEELLCGKTFSFSSQGFFQNNTLMAEKMISYCKAHLQKTNEPVIDLYGGAGTFGVSLGELFGKTTIIDIEGPNIEFARKNLKANNINGEALAGDASLLAKLQLPEKWFLITDPPRTGMHPKVLKTILALKPASILYISCNPQQLAKELRHFTCYTVASVAAFDLFPQTPHIETIAELRLQ